MFYPLFGRRLIKSGSQRDKFIVTIAKRNLPTVGDEEEEEEDEENELEWKIQDVTQILLLSLW